MGVLSKLLGDNGANVAATLMAVYLTGRLALPARWLSGINIYRAGAATTAPGAAARNGKEGDDDGSENDVSLGGAETVAQLRLSALDVSLSAFYDDWSSVVTALAVLAANFVADVLRSAAAAASSLSPSPSRGTVFASLWAAATALHVLAKVEVEQARMLNTRWSRQLRESAAAAAASAGVALLLLLRLSSPTPSTSASSSSISRLLPSVDLDGAATEASRLLHAATEIRIDHFPRLAAALPLAALAGALAPLLSGSAARGARAAAVATDAFGRRRHLGRGFADMVYATSLLDRAALRCAVLVAPLSAALLWFEPCARVWTATGTGGGDRGGDDAAVASLRSLSLLAASAASALAARPAVVAHCNTALVLWWTRKHGFVARRRKRSGGGAGGAGSGGGVDPATTSTAARRHRAGEVLRLSMQFINLFSLKAGVQALAPALLWGSCGAIALSASPPRFGGPGDGAGGSTDGASPSLVRSVALWLGGWSAAAYSLCSLWHLVLYWCGWLTDVPSGGKR